MARAGINYADVTKAAKTIRDNNQNPTVDRVLAHLGSGSKSTIAPLLKQWKIEQGQAVDATGLSDDILKAVKDIHDQLKQSAEVKIEQVMEESNLQILDAKEALIAALAQIEQLNQDNEHLVTQLKSTQTGKTKLKNQLGAEYITVARLTSDNKALVSQLDQFKVDINEQKQETQHIRESLKHYQTEAAEDRQLEREQYQINRHQQEERIHEINQQLNIELKRSELLASEKQHLNEKINQLSNHLDQSKDALQALKLETNDLIQMLKTKEDHLKALKQSNQALDSKFSILITENSRVQTTKLLLEREIEQLKTILSDANDNLSIQNDENKAILQEKSMLQGQFKQLQDSMRFMNEKQDALSRTRS